MNTATSSGGRGAQAPRGHGGNVAAPPPPPTAGAAEAGDGGGIVGLILREAATAEIGVQPLRGGVSVLTGSGGNIAVLATPEGKVMVDAGIAVSRPRIRAALDGLGRGPVRYVINTHWHFDHTGGNEWLHEEEGATVVAHKKTWERMSAATRVEGWGHTFSPSPEGALPEAVFVGERSLELGGATLCLRYCGPAHTDTDLCVHFEGADVLHVGDTWWNGHYPFLDYSTGGGILGTIRATEENLARAGRDTLIVPGHGPVGTRWDLVGYRDMLVSVYERVALLKRQGRTLGEVVAARPTTAFDARWGAFLIGPDAFTGLVYAGA